MFSLKKWNAVAMWSWDVECDTCAICRVQVMDACLRCQAENKQEDCVVVRQPHCPFCTDKVSSSTAITYLLMSHASSKCGRHDTVHNYTLRHLKCKCHTAEFYSVKEARKTPKDILILVWGECNHSFHNCCMSLWVKQNNRCPLCQQDWVVQRIGK